VTGESSLPPNGLLTRLVSGSTVAGYRLEEQVGAGGMAVVFAARDERLGRRVALKVLAPGLAADEEFRRRFGRESRAAAAVDDPHILPVYEAGEADGVLFIAMRLVSGGDLGTVIRQEGPQAPARAMALVAPVASALDAAHAAGLVHRDVKPGNVLVDRRPGRADHVYLADFGLSKDVLSSVDLTGPGQFMGTPNYAAPEQINGRAVDGRADQYSLACVAYTLMAGAAPFARAEPMAVMWAHLSAPPPSLAAARPDLPPDVDQVLARALAKAPEHRYDSCREFADALSAALGTDATVPVVGDVPYRTPSPPARPGRRGRSGRIGLIGAAAVTVLVAAAIAAATLAATPSSPRLASHPSASGKASTPSTPSTIRTVSVRRVAILNPLRGGLSYACSVTFSPDGRTLAFVGYNSKIYLWNPATGRRTATLTVLSGAPCQDAVTFSPDGKRLAAGGGNGVTYLWDRATDRRVAALTDPDRLTNVVAVVFSPDGKTLITAGFTGRIDLWDLADGKRITTFNSVGSSIAVSPDGKTLAVGGSGNEGGRTILRDLATGKRVATLTDPGANSPVFSLVVSVAFSPDGKTLATGDSSGSTYLWDLATGTVIATLTDPGRNSSVESVAFSPDGKTLAAGDSEGVTYLWDLATGTVIATVADPGRHVTVLSVAFSPGGTMLATGDSNGGAYLWKLSRSMRAEQAVRPRSG
jgi:serine/threonine-protein kinase